MFVSPTRIAIHQFGLYTVSFEALVELTEDSTIWEADSQDERLRLAYVQFSAECKRHRVSDLFARISVSAFGFTFPLDFIFS